MKTYLLKLDDAVYAEWQDQAKRAGVKLAELIRLRMRNGDGQDRPTENASRAADIPVAERGTSVSRRSRGLARKPKGKKDRTIHADRSGAAPVQKGLCRHGLLNCTVCT